jgi:glutamyl-tRNA synthetase
VVSVEPASNAGPACALYKDRCSTVVELADWIEMMFVDVQPSAEDLAAHVTDAVRPALQRCANASPPSTGTRPPSRRDEGDAGRAQAEDAATGAGLRVLVCGRAQTPSIDAVLALFPARRCCSDCAGSEKMAILLDSLEQR